MKKKIVPAEIWASVKLFWKEPPKGRFLTLKEIASLGGASLGVSFICNIVQMYITIGYLPTLYNMGSKGNMHATIICLVASLIGFIITPIYGKMLQRTKTKWGRYKPYILFLAPLVSILSVLAVWSPQNLNTTQTTIWVYCLATPTLVVWNLWFNAWNMFPGVFTPNQQERADIWSPIGLVIGFAPTIMNVLKDLFAGIWGDITAARIISIVSAVLGTVLVFFLVRVKERVFVAEKESEESNVGVWAGLKMVLKNRPLMILALAMCLGCMRETIGIYWHIIARVKFAGDMATGAKIFGSVSLIVGFAATPNMILLPLFTRKMNNRSILMMWQTFHVVAYLIFALIGFNNFAPGTWSAVIITALRFVASFNAVASLIPLMLSEIGDYQQYKSGYRLDGFIQTIAYVVVSIITQLFMLIPAIIQDRLNFNPADYQIIDGSTNIVPADAAARLDQYANIAIWISVVSSALMLGCLFFYNLNKKKHAEILAALKAESVNAQEIESEMGDVSILEAVVGTATEEGENTEDQGADPSDEAYDAETEAETGNDDAFSDGEKKTDE